MSVGLRIEQSDGTLRDELDALSGRWTRAFADQARGEVQLLRDDWIGVEDAIDERNDRLFILEDGSKAFGGRFDDVQTNGSEVTLRINSPEIDAMDAQPTGANVIYQNVDAETIATDAIDSVGTLSRGTITLSATGISYTISHGSQSKILYDLMAQTGAEFRYNSDWSVDVVDSLGSDLSGSVLLGPAQSNLGTGFRKTVDERENVTHVEGLGGESGPSQVTATAVAPSFSGGREKWRRYKNKEVIDESRLQDIVDELVVEYDGEPRFVEISATVYDEPLQLGDSVPVYYPEENIDRTLRVVKLATNLTRQQGKRLEATLSNRLQTRTSRSGKRNDDLERFNRGFGGFVDRDQIISGWNGAGDGVEQTLPVRNWPDDIVTEKVVELSVLGRAWRSPIQPVSTTSASNSDYGNVVESVEGQFFVDLDSSQWKTLGSLTPGDPTAKVSGFIVLANNESSTDATFNVRLRNTSTGFEFPDSNGIEYFVDSSQRTTVVFFGVDASDCQGETVELQITTPIASDTGKQLFYHNALWAEGKHTHDIPDTATPKVIDTFDGTQYYPTDVEIAVGGSTITTITGDSTQAWDATVDLTGKLTAGSNDITATPTGNRGEVNLILNSELFRRGRKSN